jgi:hypothetical protein
MEPIVMKALAAALTLFALSSPALAQDGPRAAAGRGSDEAPGTSGQSGDNEAQAERRICRRTEAESGSRMGTRRVCRTASEWRDAARRAAD